MNDTESLTNEQFVTYSKLLVLAESLIDRLPEKEQEEFRQKKRNILLEK